MRTTSGRTPTTPTSRTTSRRVLVLAVALALPLLSACQPDLGSGLVEVNGTAGQAQQLVGAAAPGTGTASAPGTSVSVLDGPGGVAVNQGVRYVADTLHQRVLRFTASSTCVVMAGPQAPTAPLSWCMGPRTEPLLQHPTAIAVDQDSNVYVADPQADRVFMTGVGTVSVNLVAGNGQQGAPVNGAQAVATPLGDPTGLAVSRDGKQLYIADSGAHQVLSVDVSALPTTTAPRPSASPSTTSTGMPGGLIPLFTLPVPTSTGTGSPSPASTSSSSTPTGSPTGSPSSTSPTPDAAGTATTSSSSRELAEVRVDTTTQDSSPADDEQPSGDSSTSAADGATSSPTNSPSSSPSAAPSTQGRLFVVAGPGCAPGPGGRPVLDQTVPALSAGLSTPSSITLFEGVESPPELYVTDSTNHQIYSITDGAPDQPRDLTTIASDDTALAHVGAIAVANSMGVQVVVSDTSTGKLITASRWDEPMTWTTLTTTLKAPSALAADRSSVLVTDSDADALYGIPLGDRHAGSGASDVQAAPAGTPLAAAERVTSSPAAVVTGCAPSPAPSTGSPSSAPAQDPVFSPRSSSSSSRPKVPGNAVVPDPGAHRFSGNDRVATSVDTSQQLFPKAGSVPVVVISSASSYADSAGGARYAAEKGGSLLLTPGNSLAPAVEAEVRRSLAAGGSIVVTGREDAISPSVFAALEKIAPGRTERVGGVDRYETATKLAQRLSDQMTTTATGPIYLVTGADYPDALVVVSLARRTGGLIVLSKDGVLPPVTKALLQQMDPTGARTIPVGGAAATAAASLGGDAGRTAAAAAVVGQDRYETARKVAERFVALDAAAGARTDVVGLATGTTWPDALVGSTAMGTLVGPLLLNHGDQLDPNVVKALAAIPSSRPSSTVVFGGEAAVPASVMAAFGAAARG